MTEVLIVDTSTDVVAAALGASSSDSSSVVMSQHAQHSENILVAIDQLFVERNIDRTSVSAIGVGVGPGMFTGLRVGIATAHSYAQALNIPLVFLSSLEIAALATCREQKIEGDVIVARDARRHELYFAHMKIQHSAPAIVTLDTTSVVSSISRIVDESLISPSDFVRAVNDTSATVILDDRERYEEFAGFDPSIDTRLTTPILDPAVMIDHVIDAVMASMTADFRVPQPLYIRKSDAELSWGTP